MRDPLPDGHRDAQLSQTGGHQVQIRARGAGHDGDLIECNTLLPKHAHPAGDLLYLPLGIGGLDEIDAFRTRASGEQPLGECRAGGHPTVQQLGVVGEVLQIEPFRPVDEYPVERGRIGERPEQRQPAAAQVRETEDPDLPPLSQSQGEGRRILAERHGGIEQALPSVSAIGLGEQREIARVAGRQIAVPAAFKVLAAVQRLQGPPVVQRRHTLCDQLAEVPVYRVDIIRESADVGEEPGARLTERLGEDQEPFRLTERDPAGLPEPPGKLPEDGERGIEPAGDAPAGREGQQVIPHTSLPEREEVGRRGKGRLRRAPAGDQKAGSRRLEQQAGVRAVDQLEASHQARIAGSCDSGRPPGWRRRPLPLHPTGAMSGLPPSAPAAAPGPPVRDDATRRAELRVMKRAASGLLLVAFVVFVVARWLEPAHPWLGFVRATAEASLVGGLADWFAVTALFRRPLGLPIPHTAIIQTQKDRIGRVLGNFVQNHFLSKDVLAARLTAMRVAERAARWLTEPENSDQLARHLAVGLAQAVQAIPESEVRTLIQESAVTRLKAMQLAPILGNLLSVVATDQRHQVLLDEALRLAGEALEKNREEIRLRIREESPWWVPGAVDQALQRRLESASQRLLEEVRNDPRSSAASEIRRRIPGLRRAAQVLPRGHRPHRGPEERPPRASRRRRIRVFVVGAGPRRGGAVYHKSR